MFVVSYFLVSVVCLLFWVAPIALMTVNAIKGFNDGGQKKQKQAISYISKYLENNCRNQKFLIFAKILAMKTRISILLLALSIMIVGMSSCAIQEVSVGTPRDVKLNNLSLSGISISGKIPIENPNNFGFNVKGVKLDVTINDIPIGCLNKKEKIHVNPKSKDAYQINYDASFKDVVKDPKALIGAFTKGGATLKLSGYVKVSKFIVSKKIKVDHQENLSRFKIF